MRKLKLVGNLIDCIYRTVSSDSLREEIYDEFAVELLEKDFNNISFLDECTEDEVFWDVLRMHGLCEPIEEEEDADADSSNSISDDLTIVDDGGIGQLKDDDDEDDLIENSSEDEE